MIFKRVLMETTTIVIVILFLGTGIQPATIHSNQLLNTAASNELNVKLEPKINLSSVALEKNMIKENRFVEIKKITENIEPYISIHLIYYASETNANSNLAIKETVYYDGLIFSSAFISNINNNLEILNLKSSVASTSMSNSMKTHTENINPGQILCWTDEIGPNGGFILSFNNMNTQRLVEYIALPGSGGIGAVLTGLVAKAAPIIATALGVTADALESAFSVVLVAMVVTAAILELTNALGGYQGIYFGMGVSVVNLWLTTIDVPYPLLNSNPAHGFIPISTQSV